MRFAARTLCFAILSLALAQPAFAGRKGDLRVGTCSRDITPISAALAPAYEAAFGIPALVNHESTVYLAGFGNGRAATGYHDRLWARGIVIDGKGGRIALVTLDVVGYFVNEVETIRSLVSPSAGVDYLVVHSTHQHEGPDTMGLWGETELASGIDFGYLDFINAAVADCVEDAAAHLVKARVRYATGRSDGLSLALDPEDDGFGVSDGKVLAGDDALAPATEGRIVDPRLGVAQFTTRGHPFAVLATLANFASHPESLGSNNTLVTADFPGFARQRIEAEFGGLALWVSADLGVLQGPLDIDVQDPLTGQPAARRTFRWAEVHGTQLAERAIQALPRRHKPGFPAPRVSFASTSPVFVPLANPYFRLLTALGVLNVRRSLYTDGVPDASVGFPFPPPFDAIPQSQGEDIQTEVGAFRVGDASFAVIPGELDPQIGEVYRRHMKGAKHTFLIGLGNDEIGYQLPAAKWDDSCHACAPYVIAGFPEACPVQPIDCNTVFSNNVGPGVDPAISGALLPLIDELHGKRTGNPGHGNPHASAGSGLANGIGNGIANGHGNGHGPK